MDDPFDLLGLPPRFDLDEADLHRRYLAASAQTHPDRFRDPLDQADAAERAAHINAAHRTLKDVEQRAWALLRRLRPRNPAAAQDDQKLPPDLLMEMMEIRERLDDAVARNDAAALTQMRAWAESQRQARLAAIAAAFAKNDLQAVPVQLNALRYVQRMREQMPR
jgi:molecular chaperone HscB